MRTLHMWISRILTLSPIQSFSKALFLFALTTVVFISACHEPKVQDDKSKIELAAKADSIALIQSIESRYPGIMLWDTMDYAYTLAYQRLIEKTPFILIRHCLLIDVFETDSTIHFRLATTNKRPIYYEITCSGPEAKNALLKLVPDVHMPLEDALNKSYRDMIIVKITGFNTLRYSVGSNADDDDEDSGELFFGTLTPLSVRGELVEIIKGP